MEAPARNNAKMTTDSGADYDPENDPLYPGDGITYDCEVNYIFFTLKKSSIRVTCGPDGTFDSIPEEHCRRKLYNNFAVTCCQFKLLLESSVWGSQTAYSWL